MKNVAVMGRAVFPRLSPPRGRRGITLSLIVGLVGVVAPIGIVSPVAAAEGDPSLFVQVATGVTHTCAVTVTGTAQCWGDNAEGQLGDGSRANSTSGVDVDLQTVTQVAVGTAHSCALLIAGTVWCWGGNSTGALGNGTDAGSPDPVQVPDVENVVQIAAGGSSTCAVKLNGSVLCWGSDSSGQLGDGRLIDSLSPVAVQGVSGAIQVGVGLNHACALDYEGTVMCWGAGDRGQRGDLHEFYGWEFLFTATSVRVAGGNSLFGATQLSVGGAHTCARLDTGSVACWGANESGQVGTTMGDASPYAEIVPGLDHVVDLTAGTNHTCARIVDGSARCWGGNDSGQVGDGTRDSRSSLFPVSALRQVRQLSAGGSTTCAVIADGSVNCWGSNADGQFGDGTTDSTLRPSASLVPPQPTQIVAGASSSCLLLSDSRVLCWGANESGQLGDGTTTAHLSPVEVVGLEAGVVSLAAGAHHVCALVVQGTVFCWGGNGSGEVGDGTDDDALEPVPVGDVSGVTSIAAGGHNTCAVLVNSSGLCWGDNSAGQLGDGTTLPRLAPVAPTVLDEGPGGAERAAQLRQITQITVGAGFTCAVRVAGSVWCWGDNSSHQVSPGSAPLLPEASATGVADAVQVAAGHSHICAVRAAGAVSCWGDNRSGQLGNNSTEASSQPVTVLGAAGISQVAAGDGHTCARAASGAVDCWGRNDQGQAGIGSLVSPQLRMVSAQLDHEATVVAAGGAHTCTVGPSGAAACWGENASGQIGDGTVVDGSTPTAVILAPIYDDQPAAAATLAVPYSYVLPVFGVHPIRFTRTFGSLPPGLRLTSAGVISGRATTAGTYRFKVSARNEFGIDVERITIAVGTKPEFTAESPPGSAALNGSYFYSFVARGVPAPTFELASGILPTGLVLNEKSGLVSGSPRVSGDFRFTVRATNGIDVDTTAELTVRVTAPPTFTSVTPTETATRDSAYAYAFAASGWPAPTFTVATGALPTGLTLSSVTGLLSGKPTATGNYSFTVQASNGVSPAAVSSSLSIAVRTAATGFSSASPPANLVRNKAAASYRFVADGFPAPTYGVASGSLPTGMSLSPDSGLFSGTPSRSGAFTFTVRATNGVGTPVTTAAITVNVGCALEWADSTPETWLVQGRTYNYKWAASCPEKETYTVTYSVSSGKLPAGLVLNASTGVMSGTLTGVSTEKATFSFQITATTGITSVSSTQTITVAPVPQLGSTTPTDGKKGKLYEWSWQSLKWAPDGYNVRVRLEMVSGTCAFILDPPSLKTVKLPASGTACTFILRFDRQSQVVVLGGQPWVANWYSSPTLTVKLV